MYIYIYRVCVNYFMYKTEYCRQVQPNDIHCAIYIMQLKNNICGYKPRYLHSFVIFLWLKIKGPKTRIRQQNQLQNITSSTLTKGKFDNSSWLLPTSQQSFKTMPRKLNMNMITQKLVLKSWEKGNIHLCIYIYIYIHHFSGFQSNYAQERYTKQSCHFRMCRKNQAEKTHLHPLVYHHYPDQNSCFHW